MRLTVEKRVFILESYLKTMSYVHCRQRFFEKFRRQAPYIKIRSSFKLNARYNSLGFQDSIGHRLQAYFVQNNCHYIVILYTVIKYGLMSPYMGCSERSDSNASEQVSRASGHTLKHYLCQRANLLTVPWA